ncbi:hypothetical protein EMIHUDRAFT_455102, partial [Emiliania huxleyi CCMP1516]|uniref:Uncharacterized protein n=2 Tax=Emiliania huxleyi TaxID=2903 RepID=A0A0D3KKF4_EMIH1
MTDPIDVEPTEVLPAATTEKQMKWNVDFRAEIMLQQVSFSGVKAWMTHHANVKGSRSVSTTARRSGSPSSRWSRSHRRSRPLPGRRTSRPSSIGSSASSPPTSTSGRRGWSTTSRPRPALRAPSPRWRSLSSSSCFWRSTSTRRRPTASPPRTRRARTRPASSAACC